MPYFLDGNNLIGIVRRTSRPTEEDRSALIAEIAERLRRTRAKATIFFDGPARQQATSLGSLTVRAPSSGTADDAIVRDVERARAPREAVVVTADRGLARRVRDAGGRVWSPAQFFERFGGEHGPRAERQDVGRVDVEAWMRYFEDERNRGG
ncbi:MAG TPA: NYN domain-containing protein [Thermoanaerobaculia bacterium]|jgi:predicted RNA-binding protein with PIN domain